AWRLAPLLLLAVVLGCGPGQGTVSGQVKYRGKPVPGGLITFVPADPRQPPAFTNLDENGRYQLTVAAGQVKISVDNRELAPVSKGPVGLPPGLRGKVKIPKGGQAQVQPGQQEPG